LAAFEVKAILGNTAGEELLRKINIVLNWFEELNDRVPVD
jgi:hypothetical protein